MGGIVARVVGMILVGWVAVEAASQPVAGAAPGSTPCRHWFDGERPGAALTGALRALAAAADQGLDPADYDAPGLAIRAATARSDEDRTRAVEVVEAAVRHYLGDLRGGRVSPDRRGLLVDAMPPPPDLDALVLAVATGEDLRIVSASIEPRHPAYARLGGALGRWRARAGAPEPPNVPMAPRVKPGMAWAIEEWDGAPALRARLAWLGDLDARTPGRDLTLADALRRFQERHGLAPDGVPGKQTVAALGVPASRRVKQIELAMERLRWLPTPGRRLVFVELPRAMLWALDLDGSGPDLSMALVVGAAPEHKTPLLASHITGVVFRPYWVPTPRILHDEILPRERSKPGWLAVHGMEIVASMEEDAPTFAPSEANLAAVAQGRLTVRQRPGAKNDLGLLKFVVPNPSCIGLHGTPHRQLFNRQRRDRSHGCIRLEDPLGLAEWVLRGQGGWDRDRIDAATQLAHSSSVRLREPVDLAVTYATASVDPDGSEHFRDDIYGLDAELELLLTAPRR